MQLTPEFRWGLEPKVCMPSNKMSRYEIFIGVWNTTGEVLETDAGPMEVMGKLELGRA
jgi:hypothetical protein